MKTAGQFADQTRSIIQSKQMEEGSREEGGTAQNTHPIQQPQTTKSSCVLDHTAANNQIHSNNKQKFHQKKRKIFYFKKACVLVLLKNL